MSEDLNRRQFVAGAATVAAASVLPLSIDAAAPVAEP
jgi:TAT (twin-arginine translocation) pathway signal sequence